ncbi:hypothetical protein L484_020090 [Morus notabilis]|uniref:Uncharacterized protein n=1 Tax=Morus notabilis TaxID=981085 RepID=W9S045_9ROSA|nr:hypothetical protein L484_020090 [Morus notabilis]
MEFYRCRDRWAVAGARSDLDPFIVRPTLAPSVGEREHDYYKHLGWCEDLVDLLRLVGFLMARDPKKHINSSWLKYAVDLKFFDQHPYGIETLRFDAHKPKEDKLCGNVGVKGNLVASVFGVHEVGRGSSEESEYDYYQRLGRCEDIVDLLGPPFVEMAKIYASDGKWDGVAAIRKMVKCNNVKKSETAQKAEKEKDKKREDESLIENDLVGDDSDQEIEKTIALVLKDFGDENIEVDGHVEDISNIEDDADDDIEECIGVDDEDFTPVNQRIVMYDEVFVKVSKGPCPRHGLGPPQGQPSTVEGRACAGHKGRPSGPTLAPGPTNSLIGPS